MEAVKTDQEKHEDTRLWNEQGFYEADKIIDQFKEFAYEYNNKGLFRMKVKESGEGKKLILIIQLEK